ncbi:TetR/AcrR family transcriptional regulator C-terminal domain-containing protein [Bacillus licheniformis]|nr:TetR/AcrR family transcriptional regulator C-terminal domain-containing protein [Bacillus licheniformis]
MTAKIRRQKAFAVHQKHFELLSSDRHLAIVTQLELRQSNLELRLKSMRFSRVLNDPGRHHHRRKEAGEFKSTLDVRLAKQMISVRWMRRLQPG